MQNQIHEIMEMFGQLNSQHQQRFMRFVEHIAKPDGFFEAYDAFIDESGGLECISLSGMDHFMDEWDKAVAV